ncbi:S41 family peptidase [Sunxiuqinia sp. sy24]|uniref:S41 family peptidase n=1 Tax=Sunxiuqinia sp. sy24 TaxID=3461495 RepID=UPI004045BBE8
MNRKQISIYLPILIAVSVIIGIVLGNNLSQLQQPSLQNLAPPRTNKLSTIVELINQAYVDSVETDELVEKTIPELLKNLDPHTAYIPARDMQEVHEEMQGNFGGIGVQFSIHNDTVQVIDVVSGGPSYQLGILPGDRIVTVNDSVIAGIDIKNQDVLTVLRGEKGTNVRIGVKRRSIDELIEFEITRGDIPIYSIDVSYMIDDTTGFIKVNRFAEKTYDEFINAISKLKSEGAEKFIVDLRGNPGGYLASVVSMVNEFLAEGKLIVYTEGKSQPRKTYTSTDSGIVKDQEVIVLIDEFSASASEIFAGAIQDNDRGIVVGRRSFGKGLVQEQIPFRDGSALRLTVARYYTPSGRSIQKPYEEGNMDYYHDIINRAEHGEFQVADSIHFADSLKYETAAGRIVYGGGGIMPDYFVSADTSGYSGYFSKITQKALVYHFAFQYSDEHREKLNELKTAAEFIAYLDQDQILNKFVGYAAEKGVKRDSKGLKSSGKIIETQIKAYIARNIIGEEGFFPIIKEIDETLKEAIRLSQSKKQLSQLLAVTN